jgi:uncharacterized small protein (TIGR04563 family)
MSEYKKNRKTIYLPKEIREEIEAEAQRQERTVSWLLKRAWLESRGKIKGYPSV